MSYENYGPPPEPARETNPLDLLIKGEVRWRAVNPDGSVAWDEPFPNGAATVGLNLMLNVMFRGTTASTAWYVGLIDDSGFTATASGDTMSSHAGWSESTAYSNSTRVQWSPGAAASGSLTNSSAMAFTINATATVRGIFVCDVSTKSTTTGNLWATATESSGRAVSSGQQLQVYYTVTLTPA
jgi:hypothetical protein